MPIAFSPLPVLCGVAVALLLSSPRFITRVGPTHFHTDICENHSNALCMIPHGTDKRSTDGDRFYIKHICPIPIVNC